MRELTQASNEIRRALELGFDIRLAESVDAGWFRVNSKELFVAFAEDATGGVYLSGSASGRILYVTSEGQAGVVAMSLREFLQLIVTHPYWFDLLKFSGNGNVNEMLLAVPYLEAEQDDLEAAQDQKTVSFGLNIGKNPSAIQVLHRAVSSGGDDIEVLAPDGNHFGSLFNKFTVASNPMWRRFE
jgi:hypothetical protein